MLCSSNLIGALFSVGKLIVLTNGIVYIESWTNCQDLVPKINAEKLASVNFS